MRDLKMIETELQRIFEKFDNGQEEQALVELRALSKMTGDLRWKKRLLLTEANWLSEMGDRMQARQRLADAAQVPTDSREAQLETDLFEADILMREQEYVQALRKLNGVSKELERSPDQADNVEVWAQIQTRRGVLLGVLGRWKEALPVMTEALSNDIPKGGDFYYLLAWCRSAQGDLAEALEALNAGFKVGFGSDFEPHAHFLLGAIYAKQERFAQALLELEQVVPTVETGRIGARELYDLLAHVCTKLAMPKEAAAFSKLAMKD